jgi:hypothetical protein
MNDSQKKRDGHAVDGRYRTIAYSAATAMGAPGSAAPMRGREHAIELLANHSDAGSGPPRHGQPCII